MTKIALFETPFDTYTSGKVIGEGGAGVVYEVTNSGGTVYALKCLAPARITTDRLKRFKNEISFCQTTQHANVIKVVDTGVVISKGVKCPFYVMRRYSGTLRTHIEALEPEEALRAFAQILDGVEAAHLKGVWHRDIKPENVLWDSAGKILAVADFGIAHFEEEEIYTAVETKIAARMANFAYSAPEQRSRGAPVDRKADIFALGLILNELFTKEVPQGAGYKRVSDNHLAYSYIDDVVDLMIQQNPAKRPASIEEIKKELIGHKNAFVALQKFDEASRQVVPENSPLEFDDMTFVDFDYSDGVLTLILDKNVPAGWSQEFNNPRGGHSGVMGYGPERFRVAGSKITIDVEQDKDLIQRLVNYAKNYLHTANQGYKIQLEENARRRDREVRSALEKKVAEAELRKNILANVKL